MWDQRKRPTIRVAADLEGKAAGDEARGGV